MAVQPGRQRGEPAADRQRIDPAEEQRRGDAGDGGHAHGRALKLALFALGHLSGHQRLKRRHGQPPKRVRQHGGDEHPSRRRPAHQADADRAADQAQQHGLAVPQRLRHRPHDQPLHSHVQRPDHGQQQTDLARTPAIAILRIEDEDRREDVVGEVQQEGHPSQTRQFGVTPQQDHRPHGIGAPPAELHPLLDRQTLGQDDQAVQERDPRHQGGGPERRTRADLAQEPADHGTQHEAPGKGRADQTVGLGAPLDRGDVGHIGVDGGEARRGDARHDPPDRQPPQVRRHRHQHIVDGQPRAAQQDHRPTPVLVPTATR